MKTPDAFGQYDSDLNLDPAEHLRALKFHNELTAALKFDGLISTAFLQGSFARKTMLKPLRDIDKVVILHGNFSHFQWKPSGAQIVATLTETAPCRHYPNPHLSR